MYIALREFPAGSLCKEAAPQWRAESIFLRSLTAVGDRDTASSHHSSAQSAKRSSNSLRRLKGKSVAATENILTAQTSYLLSLNPVVTNKYIINSTLYTLLV